MTEFDKFCEVSTVHEAVIQFWWAENRLHDLQYRNDVDEKLDNVITEIQKEYDIYDDTRFCCQWEGFRLYGSNLYQVRAAASWLTEELSKIDGVKSLADY